MPKDHDSGSPAKRASDRERAIKKELKECEEQIRTSFTRKLELEKQLRDIYK